MERLLSAFQRYEYLGHIASSLIGLIFNPIDYILTNTDMSHVSDAERPILLGQSANPITYEEKIKLARVFSKMMHCDVVFGTPSMDCNGTGICKIIGTTTVQAIHLRKSCSITSGYVSATANGGISLFFFRKHLCIRLYRQHFHKGVLTIKEACTIPEGISGNLNINANKLLPGNYSVIEYGGFFSVDINCA